MGMDSQAIVIFGIDVGTESGAETFDYKEECKLEKEQDIVFTRYGTVSALDESKWTAQLEELAARLGVTGKKACWLLASRYW